MKLLKNLACGARLAFFRRISPECFDVTAGQVIALFAVDFALAASIDLIRAGSAVEFNIWGVYHYTFSMALFVLSAWLVSLGVRRPAALAEYSVAALAALPYTTLTMVALEAWLRWMPDQAGALYYYAWYVVLLWIAVIMVRAVRVAGAIHWPRQIALGLVAIAVSIAPLFWLPQQEILQQAYQAPPRPRIDVEKTFYAQPSMLADAFDGLAKQRPGVVDLYFIGFAGYAPQDVFLKETNYVRALFDRRFDTHERSLVLSNNSKTTGRYPIASASNLARALQHVGTVMDPDEDVLFLFLTSHGDVDLLAVDFWPLDLNDLGAYALRDMLKTSKAKWKVIVISACHSGSFIDKLKDETTLIMTAARSDRKSFGCSAESDFTYFSKALFDGALGKGATIRAAFDIAKAQVQERERREKLEPSLPQIYSTPAIESKLNALQQRLAEQTTNR